jgi:hypothetical protein
MAAARRPVDLPLVAVLAAWLGAGALLTASPAYAQTPGTIAGTVVQDSSNRTLPGTVIHLISDGTLRSTVTDRFGRFAFTNLPLGEHRLLADLLRFELAARRITLTAERSEIDLTLSLTPGTADELGPLFPGMRIIPLQGSLTTRSR